MRKVKQVKVPMKFYNFLKSKAKEKNTSMRIEADNMLDDYFKLKKLERSLESKRGKLLIIK